MRGIYIFSYIAGKQLVNLIKEDRTTNFLINYFYCKRENTIERGSSIMFVDMLLVRLFGEETTGFS